MSFYNFAADKERLFTTLTKFDGNDSGASFLMEEDILGSAKTKPHLREYHTFFLHILLENVCNDIEPNEKKRETLFKEVCKALSKTKFLNQSLALDSLLPLRRKVAQQFFNFVRDIHIKIVPEPSVCSITADSFMEESDFSAKLELQYRYQQNFEELEVIAKGGFGVVCKARHKVTDVVYAVKKVIFKYKSDSEYLKVIREAKNIAALNHPHIVSYNNAWIECLPPSEEYESEDSSSNSSSDNVSESSSDTVSESSSDNVSESSSDNVSESSSDNVSESSCDNGSKSSRDNAGSSSIQSETSTIEICSPGNSPARFYQRNVHRKRYSTKILKENFSFTKTSALSVDSKESNSNKDISFSEASTRNRTESCHCSEEISSTWNPDCMNVRVMLCIQMEYCDCDLRLWLDKRAEGKELPFSMDVMRIFKDILHGVVHIHSKNIIHRDLKPQNIFFSKASNTLKIGDFGLATLTGCATDDKNGTTVTEHSANLGTIPYAAPEQRTFMSYDSKVDIYSLGIILIELLNVFSTKMEFSKTINEILKGVFPEEMEKNWPMLISLVKNLVKKVPKDRMSAKEILSQLQAFETSESSEVKQLKVALMEKEEENARLKALIDEQQSLINRLKIDLGQ